MSAFFPCLLADIGGTRARFALTEMSSADPAASPTCGPIWEMPAADAESFTTLVAGALACCPVRPRRAVLAVAGTIQNATLTMVNRNWRVEQEDARRSLGLERLTLINDFAAVAAALPHLTADELAPPPPDAGKIAASPSPPAPAPAIDAPGPRIALGPGTGLGVAAWLPAPPGGMIVPSEGGHATLAAVDAEESAILRWLQHIHGHVSAERVLSGPGLVALYQAVAARRAVAAEAAGTDLTPAACVALAADGDPIACESVHLFSGFLGNFAGNMALTFAATGGIFLTGGVLEHLEPLFDWPHFLRRLVEKGRMTRWQHTIPVWRIRHPYPAFRGLAALAATD